MEKTYRIEGLDCANCAAKLEGKFNDCPDVDRAVLTFATGQLRITAADPDALIPELQDIADNFEDGITIVNPDEEPEKAAGSEESKEEEGIYAEHKEDINRLIIGTAVFIAGAVLRHAGVPWWLELSVFVIAYLILGGEVLVNAVKNLGRGQLFDENFLMSIATIGAFIVGEFPEAVGVMLFYDIGELFEDIAVDRSRSQIMKTADMRPDTVEKVDDHGHVHKVAASEARVGDLIQVRPGDRIPLDGTVVQGESRIDTSPVTGEPVPVTVAAGTSIMSGCVNETGLIQVRVDKELSDSMVTRILDSVENAAAQKPRMERFITRFARVYTPFVVAVAVLTAIIPSLITGNWSKWIYTALTFLVISCPCALVLSVPLAFFAGIGAGSKQGILFKGGVALEALNKVRAIVMDKTGTITRGDFRVQSVRTAAGADADELLCLAGALEAGSTHPIAQSITERVQELDDDKKNIPEVKDVSEVAGKGIKAQVQNGETALIGNALFLRNQGVDLKEFDSAEKNPESTVVLVALGGRYQGFIEISDTIKPESASAVKAMKARGLKTAMLTGDGEASAKAVADKTGIDYVAARLLPDGKVDELGKIRAKYGPVMFIGDGINDAPVLSGADVGAAMGSGADAAIEAADVVFMNSSLTAVPESYRIARKSCAISRQNVIFALAVKVAVMVLGLCGIASMWMAVFADSGVAMLCVANSIRALHVPSDKKGKNRSRSGSGNLRVLADGEDE